MIEKILTEICRLKKDLEGYSAQEALDQIEAYINLISRKPPLPSNLDEAAEKYSQKEYPDEPSVGQFGTGDYEPYVDMEYPREIARDAFKAGVEWMAGRGVTSEGKVFTSAFTSYIKTPGIEELLKDTFPEDTEVIVQIRKKEETK